MIHQNHMPLDQRHEYGLCKCAALGCLRHIAIFSSGDPKHVGIAIGDSRDAKRFCTVLRDSQLPWMQTRRSVHYRADGSKRPSSVSACGEVNLPIDGTHGLTPIASPIPFVLYACQFSH